MRARYSRASSRAASLGSPSGSGSTWTQSAPPMSDWPPPRRARCSPLRIETSAPEGSWPGLDDLRDGADRGEPATDARARAGSGGCRSARPSSRPAAGHSRPRAWRSCRAGRRRRRAAGWEGVRRSVLPCSVSIAGRRGRSARWFLGLVVPAAQEFRTRALATRNRRGIGYNRTMDVEIWSDVVCPWCYIGKRRFEHALAAFDHRDEVTVTWRSFQLDPTRRPRRRVIPSSALPPSTA